MYKKFCFLSTDHVTGSASPRHTLIQTARIPLTTAAACLCLGAGCASVPSATPDAKTEQESLKQTAPADGCYQLSTCELVGHFTNGIGEKCQTLRNLENGKYVDYCVNAIGNIRKLKALND